MPNNHELAIEGGRPIRDSYLVFGKPKLGRDEIDEVIKTLESGWLGTGPKVRDFQNQFAEKVGTKYAIAVNSCTAGMHLSLIVAGIGPGDEVITTPMTFAATANVICHSGATPIFADCDRATMTIDPDSIEKLITPRTKAIIPVDLAGRVCRMDEINRIAKKHNLLVIEDAAHSLGAFQHSKPVGQLADLTCFSFYVTKNITTGEGGMITTNNAEFASRLPMYALHGMSSDAWKRYSSDGFKHYLVEVPGYKYNMTDMQASLGLHQLRQLELMQIRRKEIWNQYKEALKDLPLILPANDEPGTIHAHHLFTILCDLENLRADRDSIQQALHKENIGTGIHYISLHLHPYYRDRFNLKRGAFPNAEFISDRTISLPLSAALSNQDVADVIAGTRKVFKHFSV